MTSPARRSTRTITLLALVAMIGCHFGHRSVLGFGGRAASAQTGTNLLVARDVLYKTEGDSRLNTLDIYAQPAVHRRPVVIFIHGGGWRRGDKSTVTGEKAEAFSKHGYVFVTINYRLTPDVRHPVLAQDCASAIGWVHKHIAEYGGDPDSLFIMGHSAGAQLAALVCTDNRYLKAEGVPMKSVRGCIPLDGEYNLTSSGPRPRIVESILNQAFGTDPAVRRDASPLYHVAAGKDIPPFLILPVATRAPSVAQSNELAQALRAVNVRAEVEPAAGKNHATLNRELGDAGDVPTEQTYRFIDGIVKTAKS